MRNGSEKSPEALALLSAERSLFRPGNEYPDPRDNDTRHDASASRS